MMTNTADRIDLLILGALQVSPDSTIMAIAESTGLSRNTIRARLGAYAGNGALRPFDSRVDPAFLGFPLRAVILTTVRQRRLDDVAEKLATIPEVIAVDGLSGATDLLVHAVARDAEDLYATAGSILAIDGVKRTETGLVMRELVPHRILQLAPRDER